MKSIQLIYFATLSILLFSCSSNDIENNNNDILNNYTTQCNNNTITGPKAAYWDNAKGIPLSLPQRPMLASFGGQFIHNQFPALGFPLPQGYSGFEVTNQASGTFGVNVVRSDNEVVWRYVPTSSFQGSFTVTDAISLEVNQMFNFYGFTGNDFEVVCTETIPVNLAGGITRTYSARLINFGNFTGMVYAIITTVQGLGSTFVSTSVSAGPTNEFDNLVTTIFLPLNFQLLVNDNGLLDTDLDGTPDVDDPAPTNPNIP